MPAIKIGRSKHYVEFLDLARFALASSTFGFRAT